MNRLRRNLLKAAAATLALPMAVRAQSRSIVVGQTVPWSGKNGELGQDIYYGAKAAFDEANSAGLPRGAVVELAMLDDSGYPHWARANVGKLAADYSAVAVMGCVSAPVAQAAAEAAKPSGLPLWGAFSDTYMGGVHFRASVQREVGELLKANGTGVTQLALLHYDDEFGKRSLADARKAAATQLPGAKLTAVGVHRNFPLIPAQLQALIAAHPQALVMMCTADHCAQATDALLASGLAVGKTLRLMATSEAGGNQLLKALGPKGDGAALAVSVPYYADTRRAVVRRYQAALGKVQGARASYASFESYLAAAGLVETLKTLKDVTPASLGAASQKLGRIPVADFALNTDPTQSFIDLAVIASGRFVF